MARIAARSDAPSHEESDIDMIIRVVFGEVNRPPDVPAVQDRAPIRRKLRVLRDRLRRPAKKHVGDFLPAL